jgi:hypothetical protein
MVRAALDAVCVTHHYSRLNSSSPAEEPCSPNEVIGYAELVGERFGLPWPPDTGPLIAARRGQVCWGLLYVYWATYDLMFSNLPFARLSFLEGLAVVGSQDKTGISYDHKGQIAGASASILHFAVLFIKPLNYNHFKQPNRSSPFTRHCCCVT